MKKVYTALLLSMPFLFMTNVFADSPFDLIDYKATTTVNTGETFKQRIIFNYTGTSTKFKASLLGNDAKKTGITIGQFGLTSEGLNYLDISGTPLLAKVNNFKLVLTDINKVKYITPAIYDVRGLKFTNTVLPNAYELFKPYTATITYEYFGKDIPKFSFNFPPRFGRVDTDISTTKKSTVIKFTPSIKGKYTFNAQAINEKDFVLGNAVFTLNILGATTSKATATKETPKAPVTTKPTKVPFSVKSIWSSWF
jgi:hypothetical protein